MLAGQPSNEIEIQPPLSEHAELERLAQNLAQNHAAARSDLSGAVLTADLPLYRGVIQSAVQYFRSAADREVFVSYAAEWLLDNDYLIMQTLRLIEEDLPLSFSRQLPHLGDGPPRVYFLARELVLSSRARLDLEDVRRFVRAYQQIIPLTMGELWALPIMLRLVVVQSQAEAAAALTENDPRLSGQITPRMDWPPETPLADVIASGFISLRALTDENWKDFFESLSLVEAELYRDPAGAYPRMDFSTRDLYRKAVEELAAGSGRLEIETAGAAVWLAEQGGESGPGSADVHVELLSHIGYYLIGAGRSALEQHIDFRPSGRARVRRYALSHPTFVYLGGIILLVVALLAVIVGYALAVGAGLERLLLALVLVLIPASSMAIHVINWIITHAFSPRILPKMDFDSGIPAEHAALVVVPALLASGDEVGSLLKQMELHFLRNPDPALFFALATDYTDASQEEMPGDVDLLRIAIDGVKRLNRRYPRSEGGERFFLFHRPRRWNPIEGVWMGWERKRGKLHQINRLILAAGRIKSSPGSRLNATDIKEFSAVIGNLERAPVLRYVITLDADTILPLDSARRLVATHAHPLNRPRMRADGSILEGYSILQPRTEISPVSSNISRFTRIFSGYTGLDLYTFAVSDVYQDLFGEGIYVGKGIYEIAAFEASLEDRAPENALLSHDLFEGAHGRVALVTDITLIEDYPSHYLVHSGRTHRWIRGDWQILPWLLPRVPAAGGARLPNRLRFIDRWKIFDNLRRSLVSPSLILFLAAAWFGLLFGSPLAWTILAIFSLAGPLFTSAFGDLIQFRRAARVSEDAQNNPAARLASVRNIVLRWLLSLVFLLFEAGLTVNAITITLVRMWITRRNLLKWATSAQAERRFRGHSNTLVIWEKMIEAPLSALVLLVGCLLLNPASLWVAAPLLAAWLFSPAIANRISQPIQPQQKRLNDDDRRQLSLLGRRTWIFFEQFIGPEDNWLPPDHYQEFPLGVVAHRTSPTNIGLNLLAWLGAYDLGYTGLLSLSARLESSFASLQRLERYRGHFLNWYDTRSLETLPPAYVSTVDSGNLAACLLALSQGLQALGNARLLRWETFLGILDSLSLLEDQLNRIPDVAQSKTYANLFRDLTALQQQIASLEGTPQEWHQFLLNILDDTWEAGSTVRPPSAWQAIEAGLVFLAEKQGAELGAENMRRLSLYAQHARRRIETARREILVLHPWLALLDGIPVPASKDQPQSVLLAWESLRTLAAQPPDLNQISSYQVEMDLLLQDLRSALHGASGSGAEAAEWCDRFSTELNAGVIAVRTLMEGFQEVIAQAEAYFSEMDFGFLFNPVRQVFHIGYNHALGRLDDNDYDLLASEARIASLVAIAKGDVPPSHWLHLSRPVTQVNGVKTLLSWSATMFEYLMPVLLLRSYPNTLLNHSAVAAVDVQIEYGRLNQKPWGISESGYFHFDQNQAYQYRAFGVPGLGYKRGLADDLVIAPYASLLGLPFRPKEVVENIAALEKHGALGPYGMYEAVDFTKQRLPSGINHQVVGEYMAHHQGMIFLALVNFFCQDIFVRRFHADARIQSVDLLLQEQFPLDAPLEQAHLQESHALLPEQLQVVMTPWRARVSAAQPRVHYLTNGSYNVLLSAAGGGYSSWKDVDLTRWRADYTLADWGQWIYVQDLDTGSFWSIGFLPTSVQPQQQDVYFHPHQVSYTCRHDDVGASMNVAVAADDDVELRQVELTNHSDLPKRLRLVSYGEVILASQADDRRHPAFNKLFIQSEWASDHNALLFHRRLRSEKDTPLFMAHALVTGDGAQGPPAYESSRRQFIGRGRSIRSPQVLCRRADLSGALGSTLDPIFALSQEFVVQPGSSVQAVFLTLVAPEHDQILGAVERYRSWAHIDHVFRQARNEAEMELRRLSLNTPQLVRIQHLLSGLLFPHARMRASTEVLQSNRQGQPGLWAYAISGDHPILLVKLHSTDELDLAQDVLQAHQYWRRRNLKIDLVFLNEQGENYGQELNTRLFRLLSHSRSDMWINRRGGIFIIYADRLAEDDRVLLETSARVVLDGRVGGLEKQPLGGERIPPRLPAFIPSQSEIAEADSALPLPRPRDLLFDNGRGGFTPDGREYRIYLEPGALAPAPWLNVIANPELGFLTSDAGLGCTWAVNSGENRLTPWSNDPVSEPAGEAVYLRDEETGAIWTPTPLPAGAPAPTQVRHGAGYTIFEHQSHGLDQRLRLFAAPDAPVKIVQLRLQNLNSAVRRITVTYYAEWVLGVTREESNPFIIPEFDGDTQALLVRNPYNVEFGERVAFMAANKRLHGLTANRTEFLGRLGDRACPAGLKRIGLAGEVQAGKDQCAALQLHVDLEPHQAEDVYFLLGQGDDRQTALALINRFRQVDEVEAAWKGVTDLWNTLLDTVQVRTPDPGMDLLLNRWLVYQTLACRVWGRSAFYQSSGAYGFRDQLQDVMALILAAPNLAREHLLRSASCQFEQGDVLHWWHPPSGRGVRTRFSDDLIWLPYVAAHYVLSTRDDAALDEKIPFIRGPKLEPGQDENYGHFSPTSESFSLYEHCRRALEKGVTRGPHGLPLMGSGDWNDGMNRVGIEGRGESVWLAWFLIDTLRRFAQVCDLRGETAQAADYRQTAGEYIRAIEQHAWDGDWYVRAYYDDGSPLGSEQNLECRIDAIAQSWSIISEAGDPQRSRQAMKSVYERLVRQDDGLLLLFAPPFDQTRRDPGYIKGYPPGVRENGGQYTHAAIWTVWAFAMLGEGERAYELFRTMNPIYHADSLKKAERYRVEPYVIAADIYAEAPHAGMGGWTWYTGSSGWMYRLGVEAILGLRREGPYLCINPCIPTDWPGFELVYRHAETEFIIHVENPERVSRGVVRIEMDGLVCTDARIPLLTDGGQHSVQVQLGRAGSPDSAR